MFTLSIKTNIHENYIQQTRAQSNFSPMTKRKIQNLFFDSKYTCTHSNNDRNNMKIEHQNLLKKHKKVTCDR